METRSITTENKESWSCINSDLPYPLYFYAYSKDEFSNKAYTYSIPMAQAPSIQNVMYCPFLTFDDLHLIQIPYDKSRFGTDPLRPAPEFDTYVYRVSTFAKIDKDLGYLLPYRNISADPGIGKPKSWRNESKLWQYPYRKLFIGDGMNTPLEIKTYLLSHDGEQNRIKVKLTMSNRMSYGLYVSGYKGDSDGHYEAMVSGDSLELPSSSSAYSQWYASNRNQTQAHMQQTIDASFLQTNQTNEMLTLDAIREKNFAHMNSMQAFMSSPNLIGNWGNYHTQNAMADTNNIIRMYQQQNNRALHEQTEKFAIQNLTSMTKDKATTPPTMLSMGGDFMYGFNNNNRKLRVSTFDITEQVAEQIGDYFALYGYMANKIMDLEKVTKSRHFYNYVKTVNASVRSKNNVPKEFINKINDMFNKGVTIWHKENAGVRMHDYTYDNYEVSMYD